MAYNFEVVTNEASYSYITGPNYALCKFSQDTNEELRRATIHWELVAGANTKGLGSLNTSKFHSLILEISHNGQNIVSISAPGTYGFDQIIANEAGEHDFDIYFDETGKAEIEVKIQGQIWVQTASSGRITATKTCQLESIGSTITPAPASSIFEIPVNGKLKSFSLEILKNQVWRPYTIDVYRIPLAYSYNGAILPALPLEIETHPYAVIYYQENNAADGLPYAWLCLMSEPCIYSGSIIGGYTLTGERLMFKWVADQTTADEWSGLLGLPEGMKAGEWNYHNTKSGTDIVAFNTAGTWSNFNIYNKNNQIHFEGTKEVPVYK